MLGRLGGQLFECLEVSASGAQRFFGQHHGLAVGR
jgi:hypothetical protein